jgi:hypothetical protein
MGLLDWLTDLGSTSGSMLPASQMNPPPAAPPLDFQRPEFKGPQPPQAGMMRRDLTQTVEPSPQQAPVDPSTTDISAGMQGGGPGGMAPQAPMPFPNAGGLPPGPPKAAPPQPSLSPEETGSIYRGNQAAGGGQPIGNGSNPGPGRGFFGQLFGMNSSDEKNMLGSLGAGLKSVGDNWNKPGLAAFSGSAGSAIEGGTKSDEKRIDDMIKMVAAKRRAGDESTATSLAQIKLETAKMQLQSLKESGGKSGAWNKPETQRFQDAMRTAQADSRVDAHKLILAEAVKSGDPKAIAAAQAEHNALIEAAEDKAMIGARLDPTSKAGMLKVPGLTEKNPIPQAAFKGKMFEQIVKPNAPYDQYFIDEKGQPRVLRATKPAASKTPTAAPPPIPTSPDDTANEEEE